jgi:hypothetical protein
MVDPLDFAHRQDIDDSMQCAKRVTNPTRPPEDLDLTSIRLSRGRHKDPRDGVCAMELVTLLAGEPWSDHPRCVHPVLAAVTRVVNDRIGEAARDRLAPLASQMIGTAAGGGAEPACSARLLLVCTNAAARTGFPLSPELVSASRTARYLVVRAGHDGGGDRRTWYLWPERVVIALLDRLGLLAGLYRKDAAPKAGLASVVVAENPAVDGQDHDESLYRLLEACLAEFERAPGLPC